MNPVVTVPFEQALHTTRLLLFRAFSVRRWLILGFCAFLAYLGKRTTGFRVPLGWGESTGEKVFGGQSPGEWLIDNTGYALSMGALFLLVGLAVAVLLGWISARGQFVYMHALVTSRTDIAGPWKRYGPQADSLFRLTIGIWIIALVVWAGVFALMGYIAWPDLMAGRMRDATGTAFLVGALVGLPVVLVQMLISFVIFNFLAPAMFANRCNWRDAWVATRSDILGSRRGDAYQFLLVRVLLGVIFALIIYALSLVTWFLLQIPYLGTVLTLPMLVFERAYTLHFVEQFGTRWQVFEVGRDNCRACGYPMAAVSLTMCPECGLEHIPIHAATGPSKPVVDVSTLMKPGELVEVTQDIQLKGVRKGDIGPIVDVLTDPVAAYEVRLADDLTGESRTVTLRPRQVKRWNLGE